MEMEVEIEMAMEMEVKVDIVAILAQDNTVLTSGLKFLTFFSARPS